MINNYSINNKIEFYSVNNMDNQDKDRLLNELNITPEVIEYANDMKEQPRIEYISSINSWIMVFHVISNSKVPHHITLPITFIVSNSRILLFTSDKTQYVAEYFKNLKLEGTQLSCWGAIFEVGDDLSNNFIDQIKDLVEQRNTIQTKLNAKKIKEKEIIELSKIQEGLTYLLTSANGNYGLCKEAELIATGTDKKIKVSKEDIQAIKETIIEFEQVQTMVEILSDVTDKLSNTFNNMLNNQTNSTMKLLTIYSIALSIPTIISGFYGMNVILPLADKNWSWIFSIVITIIIIGIVLYDLKKRKFM